MREHFISEKNSESHKNYLKVWKINNEYLDDLEVRFEKGLKELFNKVNVHSMVKSDKKTLPYQKEIIQIIPVTSYINEAFYFGSCNKRILKEILNTDCLQKIRFYSLIDVDDPVQPAFFTRINIIYKFRYYEHY